MVTRQLSQIAKTLKYMVAQGYRRDKALLACSEAFALTPEEVTILARLAA